jgi:hypothetical protein
MEVKGFWPEPNVKVDRRRKAGFEAAIAELSRFALRIAATTASVDRASVKRPPP